MTTDIIILTANSLRHSYLRQTFGLADNIEVVKSYCESKSGSLLEEARKNGEQVRIDHLERRARSEHDYFAHFVNTTPDRSNPIEIPYGDINEQQYYEEITDLEPDLLVVYGSSIIRDPLLSEYDGRILNVHLGLSPYYRGTGTNFWPLVNGEPEYVGATFMYIDEGVDTGEIIHQLRARVHPYDGPHDIGNRLIADVGQVYPEIVRRFDDLHHVSQIDEPNNDHYYKSSDYNPDATAQLYENFADGMVEEYLQSEEERVAEVPIVKHPVIDEEKPLTHSDV
ncbi:formyl transferase [Halovenus salina]|uniref:phosphoribosylglycinamide formyltransferase 1 n=1 Tax=Halovenus salina TaxID=1510225 RepID=A0ABD5VX28_9EURY|nr:formyl transferase [Halovenus salina]